MKAIKKFVKYLVIIMSSLLLLALLFPTWTSSIKGTNSISTLEQVAINDSDHEIMIRGQNKDNPVIIFVHGGPGCSEIPYAKNIKICWKPNLPWSITINGLAGNPIIFSRTILIFHLTCLWRIY